MLVTVVNTSNNEVVTCSFTHAAKLIGVHYKTISRWSMNRKIEVFNHFKLYFDTKIVKQPVRNRPNKSNLTGQK